MSDNNIIYSDDSSDFILLTDVIADLILEIRYYSTFNFVGERIDGYLQPVALLRKKAALALKDVSDEFKEMGYRLKIYDAYRPQSAVDHFVKWANDPDDNKMQKYFYPDIAKKDIIPSGYIAKYSNHTLGNTVDLTLFDMANQKESDMGGYFDYFGELSNFDYQGINETQHNNRLLLRKVMVKHGFKPIEQEWWHFSYEDELYENIFFNFPVSIDSLKNS